LEHCGRRISEGHFGLCLFVVDRFPQDLESIDISTLVIHGDADRILPIAATGKRTPKFVKGSKLVVVEGGPHGVTWTHAEKVNQALLDFLGQAAQGSQAA
jgi:non-heme chloroperoxidase